MVIVQFVYHDYHGLQTEMDDMKSHCQLIIKITISEKRKIAKLCDNGKIYLKKMSLYTVSMVIGCDW